MIILTQKSEKIILWVGIAIFVSLFTAFGFWKYQNFQYNGIDFAIFNQTFWNTVHGRPFGLTIHPHSYLGDHAEWVILFLAPFYAILPRPETLIFLQAAVLGITAWTVWRLTKATSRSGSGRLPLLLGLLWLANPFVHNMTLNEWHGLPFALPFLFLALETHVRGRTRAFWIFAILAMLVREDVGIWMVGFGLFARRPMPAIAGMASLFINQKIISLFALGGAYKFSRFYGWIFDASLADILRHLATLPNLEMIIGFLLPFAFLPLLGPAALILTLPALAQIMLGTGGGALVFQYHYATLFLPGLVLGTIFGYQRLRAWPGLRGLFRDTPVVPVVLTIATLYTMLTLGPLPHFRFQTDFSSRETLFNLLKKIPPDASVASSYATLVPLSGRREFYSLHYLAMGKTQYGIADFPRVTPDYLVIDTQDFITYALQIPNGWARSLGESVPKNLQDLFDRGKYGVVGTSGSVVILKKNTNSLFSPLRAERSNPDEIAALPLDKLGVARNGLLIKTEGISPCPYPNCQSQYLRVTWSVGEKPTGDIALHIGNYLEQIGFGVAPPFTWEPGTTITTEHFLPQDLEIKKIQPVKFLGQTVLTGIRNVGWNIKTVSLP